MGVPFVVIVMGWLFRPRRRTAEEIFDAGILADAIFTAVLGGVGSLTVFRLADATLTGATEGMG